MMSLTEAFAAALSQGVPIKYHGNGFAQIAISPDKRLHLWHPDFTPCVTYCRIHDHRFELRSEVLFGKIEHHTYEVTLDPEGAYEVYQSAPGRHSLRPIGRRVSVRPTGVNALAKGSWYQSPAGEFHDTAVTTLTLTLLTQTAVEDRSPSILVPAALPPQDAYQAVGRPSKRRLVRLFHEALEAYNCRAE